MGFLATFFSSFAIQFNASWREARCQASTLDNTQTHFSWDEFPPEVAGKWMELLFCSVAYSMTFALLICTCLEPVENGRPGEKQCR